MEAVHRQYRESFKTPECSVDQQRAAHRFIFRGISEGWIVPPTTCQKCLHAKKVDAHHFNYSKPDHVYWLCRSCHVKTHHDPSILDGIAAFVCDEKIPREQRGPVLVDYVPAAREAQ